MWFSYTVFLQYTQTASVFGDINIKLRILSFFLIGLSIVLFIIQKVIFPRFLDVRDMYSYSSNDLYSYPMLLSIFVSFFSIISGSDNIDSLYIDFPMDFMPIFGVNTKVCFVLDNNSTRFLMVTVFIGYAVNSFVPHYMMGEVCIKRFCNLLNSFLFSMILLICSGNYITMLFFWELIGFFSYFLINFWKKKASTLKSAMKAFVYNSISDACLITFISLYFKSFGTFSFPNDEVVGMYLSNILPQHYYVGIMCLLIASSCKSAQLFFHFWLPDSMDAPAPASALIHSATLVAAGVFLLIRSKPVLNLLPFLSDIMRILSLLTVCIGGLSAAYQSDLKKILAYSTISNCGFMVYLAVSNTNLNCFLFFMSHGFFKALSFVMVGFFIISVSHKQDYAYAGNLLTHNNFISFGIILTVGSLGGLPMSLMHLIKNHVIVTSSSVFMNNFTNLCITIGILTSALYSIKTIILVTSGNQNKIKFRWCPSNSDTIWSKLTISASLVAATYIIIALFLYFLHNNIISSNEWGFGIPIYGSWNNMLFSLLINEPQLSYTFCSNKVRSALLMCYLSTLMLVSLPTWLPIFQKKSTQYVLLLPIIFAAAVLM